MSDLWISIAIGFIKGIVCVYDVLTYVPRYIIEQPYKSLCQSSRLKGKPVRDGDASSPFRSVDSFDQLTTSPFPGCNSLDELFERAVHLNSERDCLGVRELLSEDDELQPNGKLFRKAVFGNYHWQSYHEINERVFNMGSGLSVLAPRDRKSSISAGEPSLFTSNAPTNVCIFAETRAEWIISVFACFKANFPVVTLYATLGEDAVVHAIAETECSIVVTSSELLPKFQQILHLIPNVKHIVYFEDRKRPKVDQFPSSVKIHSLSSLEALGAQAENRKAFDGRRRPTRDDLALIMYTSGSTGLPKGVMISNGNLLCGMSGQCERVPHLGPQDTYVGYLPLAHVLELSAEVSCVTHGCRIGFSSPTTLNDQSTRIKKGSKGDVTVLKPTLMTAVPVIMDRLYKAVHEKVNEGGKFQLALFNYAFEYKKKKYEAGYATPLIDKLIFKKVRSLLGGRIRMMLSGGAPLSSATQLFMNICFCCPVGQGYGLTETCGAGTIQEVTDRSTGRVGAPLLCNEVMLVDWQEGNYCTADVPYARGEIWLGGGNVALGYYKNPEKTAEDFHVVNGKRWFATGDIGRFEEDGCLRIIDRKKDLVKLQAGEYVSLGKVETALKLCPLVDNLCIYADSSKMFTVCLVVPNRKHIEALAHKIGITADIGWPDLCDHPNLQQAVVRSLQEYGLKYKLEKFELPQRVKLVMEVWTPDTGLVTEAFKLRRKNIESHYITDIMRMYA
jgi:long-chain acyl-CoA synthetase